MPSDIGLFIPRLSEDTEELLVEDREGFLLIGWKGISSDPPVQNTQNLGEITRFSNFGL